MQALYQHCLDHRRRDGGLILLASCSAMSESDLVITGATLIDGSGAEPREGTTIVVRDGRITMVVPDDAVTPPENAVVINATGKHVIPGLADMHLHFMSGLARACS